ncbi:MAG: J domain-containing protein [Pseudomonadota bacterium]
MTTPLQKARAVSEAQITLGVSVDANESEIHSAWKKLAFKLHPDRGAADSKALASVNAAYTLLKDRAKTITQEASAAANAPTSTQRPVRPARPGFSRPTVTTKVSPVEPAMKARCAELVAKEPKGFGHIASAMERTGRKIIYVVETPLSEGVNRVAMPVSDYNNGRPPRPDSIAFRSSKSGPGTLDLPEAVREKAFPGFNSVKFRFGL